MIVGLVTWRESCVGTGFSWKLCTASVGKSAWPLTGAPEIVNDLGGLETMQILITSISKQAMDKCINPPFSARSILSCPILKPQEKNSDFTCYVRPKCIIQK